MRGARRGWAGHSGAVCIVLFHMLRRIINRGKGETGDFQGAFQDFGTIGWRFVAIVICRGGWHHNRVMQVCDLLVKGARSNECRFQLVLRFSCFALSPVGSCGGSSALSLCRSDSSVSWVNGGSTEAGGVRWEFVCRVGMVRSTSTICRNRAISCCRSGSSCTGSQISSRRSDFKSRLSDSCLNDSCVKIAARVRVRWI